MEGWHGGDGAVRGDVLGGVDVDFQKTSAGGVGCCQLGVEWGYGDAWAAPSCMEIYYD